jgi:hypothetical protein
VPSPALATETEIPLLTLPTLLPTLELTSTLTPTLICDRAAPGNPIDINVQDDTPFKPGQSFSKTWRLVNNGACTWTRDYAVAFFSGNLLGASRSISIGKVVLPRQMVDVTVDMVAPLKPGSYQGNWKLSSPKGNLFGIGPGGNGPFWVRIIVLEPDTPTPAPTATITTTPVVFLTSTVELNPGESLDLDTGLVTPGAAADVIYAILLDSTRQLSPVNGARVALFGAQPPANNDCRTANLGFGPLALDPQNQAVYFCYRTNQGLPGRAHPVFLDQASNILTIEIITWAIP